MNVKSILPGSVYDFIYFIDLSEQPYSLLSCDCRSRSAGKLAVELGPVWCDEIFDPVFCQAMLRQANNLQFPHKVTSLLQVGNFLSVFLHSVVVKSCSQWSRMFIKSKHL